MPSTIDSLLNQLLPVRSSSLAPAQQVAVIEAVVLSNSPLLDNGGGEPRINVTLGNDQQRLELTSRIPIPVGTRVLLKIAQNNFAELLDISEGRDPGIAAGRSPSNPTSALLSGLQASSAVTTGATLLVKPELQAKIQAQDSLLKTGGGDPPKRQLIEETVRQVLPRQQPLRTLVPLLLTVVRQSESLPTSLVEALHQLVKQLPTPEQLQHPRPLKQAVHNSGIFLESKLARRHAAETGAASASPASRNTEAATSINRDIKALIERILPQIQKLTGTAPPATTQTPAAPGSASMTINPAEIENIANPLPNPYSFVPLPPQPPGIKNRRIDQNIDILLRQLGRHLLATLARTQLNQMESLGNRHNLSNDAQSPANSWHLDIPIMHGQHIDNLELRIEQQRGQERQKRGKALNHWRVMLNFDLHQLGRMQVQLTIVEKDVSAMIWSQLQETHAQVQQHLNDLRSSLERVGIRVKKVECQRGQAPTHRLSLYRQLVDVHT